MKLKAIGNEELKKAYEILDDIEISIHCWQGDDVCGFELESKSGGGIQATGNYFGKATTPDELMNDIEFVLKNLRGKFRLNLHANYLISSMNHDRNEIEYEDFAQWVEFAKKNNLKIDFNPTFFGHEKSSTGYTLANIDDEIRNFWIEHGRRCLKIAEQIAIELDDVCLFNIWIPDGAKEVPYDRFIHRKLLKDSLDKILEIEYDKNKVVVAVESKVFGIGIESYTVGSHEFYMSYAQTRNILCLLDNGHFHPTENVADKLSSLLNFNEKVALHITRPVRWDSDHVITYNDEVKEIASEIIKLGYKNFYIATDFFDASINRTFAWISGIRSLQKALLTAILDEITFEDCIFTPSSEDSLKYKFLSGKYPLNSIWDDYNLIDDEKLLIEINKYEEEVLRRRNV